MKKSFWLIILLFVLFLAGCAKNEETNGNDLETYKAWIATTVPNFISKDVVLPTENPTLGGTIVWVSLNPEVITNDGKVLIKAGSEEVLLEYTLTFSGQTVTDYVSVLVDANTIEAIANLFEEQFWIAITRDYDVKTDFGVAFEVTWSSSNTEVFTNEGKFIKPVLDVPFAINYSVKLGDKTEEFTLNLVAKGDSIMERVNTIKAWIKENYISERLISEEITLPKFFEPYQIDLTWESSNTGVVDNDGKVTRYPFDRYVTLLVYFQVENLRNEIEFSIVVEADLTMNKEEQVNAVLKAVAVPTIPKLAFSSYPNINHSYNFLPFIKNQAPTIFTEFLMPVGGSRPGEKLRSLEFITIHDTANTSLGAGGATHQRLLFNGYDAASWHFAVDETGNYQSIPTDEVAYHAGDGSGLFKMNKTNVLATTKYPVLTVSTDGFYEFNGQKSNIKVPLAGSRTAKTSDLAPSGIYTEVGIDGYYYINNTYFSTGFARISNFGGNRHSVGIETCVNTGNDYAQTLRHTAELVGNLLAVNNLSVDRVLQHNNFSGKDCPNAMRHYGYWNNFLDLVSLEKFTRTNLQDVSFVWTSSTSLMTDSGKISLTAEVGDLLNYSVVATYGSTNIAKSFQTKVE